MASFGQQVGHRAPPKHPAHPGAYTPPMAAPGVAAPAGTFAPGTKIQVGSHRVVIQKYLSEGGFAHVYLVKMPKPIDGTDQAVLKRVAVPDREALRGMRTEVETMKRLKGHRMIVTYIDSHASELKGGGYEVFLLMEYCSGGGLIDFMNTRLKHRLTEPEIVNIFCDIAEGVACMHYLKPPLLHRDLKIENVLITSKGSVKRFKLCDFGSTSPPKPAPTSVVECRLMDEDVQKHTTLQYRSPEMVDVYRKQPLNEKSDIWALGVFLYKLCYYTTPFEDQGQLAILNASYRFPSSPPFSDRLKKLIASMLRESMESRPNIYEVLKEACTIQGREVPIPDIYSSHAQHELRSPAKALSQDRPPSKPAVGAVWSPPVEEKEKIPEIAPMRRGRPAVAPASGQSLQQPSPSARGTCGDPFAALDSKSSTDEFSSRFPSLDQFSLLHDSGAKFDFGSSPAASPQQGLDQRVTQRLADEVFASNRTPVAADVELRPKSVTPAQISSRLQSVTPAQASPRAVSQHGSASLSRTPSAPKKDVSRAQSIISSNPELQEISSLKYVSIGTSTSDLNLPTSTIQHRVSQIYTTESARSSSVPRQSSLTGEQGHSGQLRPSAIARVSSFQSAAGNELLASSSRQSLETARPQPDILDIPCSNLNVNRSRPQSTAFEANTTIDYLREKEALSRPQSRMAQPSLRDSPKIPSPNLTSTEFDVLTESNDLEFLRRMEESDSKLHRRLSSLSGSKAILATKFGDAFKRFESNASPGHSAGRTPSPQKETDQRDLTPITVSIATDGRSNETLQDDVDSMTPEMRRDLERGRLEKEERRVEAAKAEYRKNVAQGGPTSEPVPRAISIQNRVQSLFNEEQRTAPVQKTAQGYGKYSDAAAVASKPIDDRPLPDLPRKPIAMSKPTVRTPFPIGGSSTGPFIPPAKPKPAAPKKPVHLTGPAGNRPSSPIKPNRLQATEQLVAADLPGQPGLDMTAEDKDNYLREFSQRFPSVSALDSGSRQS